MIIVMKKWVVLYKKGKFSQEKHDIFNYTKLNYRFLTV